MQHRRAALQNYFLLSSIRQINMLICAHCALQRRQSSYYQEQQTINRKVTGTRTKNRQRDWTIIIFFSWSILNAALEEIWSNPERSLSTLGCLTLGRSVLLYTIPSPHQNNNQMVKNKRSRWLLRLTFYLHVFFATADYIAEIKTFLRCYQTQTSNKSQTYLIITLSLQQTHHQVIMIKSSMDK